MTRLWRIAAGATAGMMAIAVIGPASGEAVFGLPQAVAYPLIFTAEVIVMAVTAIVFAVLYSHGLSSTQAVGENGNGSDGPSGQGERT